MAQASVSPFELVAWGARGVITGVDFHEYLMDAGAKLSHSSHHSVHKHGARIEIGLRHLTAAGPVLVPCASFAVPGRRCFLHADLVRLYVMPSQLLMFRKPRGRDVQYVLSRTPRDQWGTQAYLLPDAGAAARVLAGLWPMLGAVDEQLSRVPDLAAYTLVGAPIVDELADDAPSVTLGAARPPRYVDDVLGVRAGLTEN